MRRKLQSMGVQITELSEIMGISRPTIYKFLDMYGRGERNKIDGNMLKLLDHIKRNPKMSKKDLLYYMILVQGGRDDNGRRVPTTVTVTAVERPARKLIVLRGRHADDYMSYCEEMGCGWEAVLNSVPERLGDAAIVDLPKHLVTEGTSGTASGIEVPYDYSGNIPDSYEIMDLPPCTMLFFCGSAYCDEEDFCEAIGIVGDALDSYEPARFGWRFDPDAGPSFNFGSNADKGARMAVAVTKI